MPSVQVGHARNPKDENRLGFAIHVPGRRYRVLVDPAQFELLKCWFNPYDVSSVMGEQRYRHWRDKRRIARRRR